jgi:hypothetical protein
VEVRGRGRGSEEGLGISADIYDCRNERHKVKLAKEGADSVVSSAMLIELELAPIALRGVVVVLW